MHQPPPDSGAMDLPLPQPGTWTCGTLTYTKLGLVALFAWLLWGDFVFTLMEGVVPSVLPLKLKALGASNTLMSVIMTTLPGILNMTVCPWVSFASDRYRGRWGRRLPFIFWTMPFLTISLIMLGYSEQISVWAQHSIPMLAGIAPTTVTITVIATFLVLFQLFNMFVNSVFWYLFNDVVPPQLLGRFMGLFRIVGTGAGAAYSAWVFPHAESHMREILVGAALVYFVGFGVMMLFVREGKYPPPPANVDQRTGLISSLKSFGKQSFSHRFYWFFYLTNAFGAMAGACGMFNIFFSKQMGLSLEQMGELGAWGGVAALIATYFTAVYVDRWHPLRISTYMAVFAAVGGFGGWIWVFVTLPGDLYYWLSLGGMLVGTFSMVLQDACGIPLFMRLMPKSLYGQFSSANSIIRSFARILGGVLAGVFIDTVQWMCNGSDIAYRWMFLWPWIIGMISTVFLCLGYREWKRLGGDADYRPPAPWTPSGFEEVVDKVPASPARPRAVMTAMWLGVVGALINLALIPVFMYYMRKHGLEQAFMWYLYAFVPIKLLLTLAVLKQAFEVRRDIRARERGERTRFGIPHHGVLMVNAIQGFLGFPIFWYQTMEMIHLDYAYQLILFGVAGLAGMVAGLIGMQLIRWLERDPKPAPAPAA